MAQGRTWRNRLLVILALSVYALLIVAEIAPNPLPAVWGWLSQERPLAPDLVWQERMRAKPDLVAEVGGQLVLDLGRNGEVRQTDDGALAYRLDDAAWVAVAGAGDDQVVLVRDGDGYQVRDPASGAVLHQQEQIDAVWTFTDAVLDLRCESAQSCGLRRFAPGSDRAIWSVDLPGADSASGVNPPLAAGTLDFPSGVHPVVSGPGPIPSLIGLPASRRELVVVDTASGQVLREWQAERETQLSVIGGRVIGSTAERRDGICVVSVTGYEAATGLPVWGPHPYHLRTAAGSGCEHRDRPQAAGAAMVAVDPDGRELVISAYDGRVLWAGSDEDRVVALSPAYAVVRTADPGLVVGVSLRDGAQVWEQTVHEDAEFALSNCGVLVVDHRPDRLRVWEVGTGTERLSVRTTARAMACTDEGLVISNGRSVGLAAWSDAVSSGSSREPDQVVDGPPEQK